MQSDELKRWREAHGLSQRQLAEQLGVTVTAVSHWETGHRKPAHWLRFALPQIEAELTEIKSG